jgi:hypothetical protein
MAGTRRTPAPRGRGAKKQGVGKTLHEAFEDYAKEKGKQKIYKHRSDTLKDALEAFDEWFPVAIDVQLHPHNQWIKAFRVRDL